MLTILKMSKTFVKCKRCGSPAGYATSKDHVFRLHGDGATAAWPGSKESRTTKELPAAALQVRPHSLHGHHVTLPLQVLQNCVD